MKRSDVNNNFNKVGGSKKRRETVTSATLLGMVFVLASITTPFYGIGNSNSAYAQGSDQIVDFNGDGYEDIAIGVPFEEFGTLTDAGIINVLYGSSSGLQASSPADQTWSQDTSSVKDVAEDFDYFGWSLAAGDFNGDSYTDLAVGVPAENVGSITDAGAVNILYGSSSGLQASSPDDQIWHQDTSSVKDVAEIGDNFGWSLAAGDFNGDGKDDLAVGVPFEDIGSITDAGAVNILYGSSSGLQASSPDDQIWHQDTSSVKDVAEIGDNFGYSLATGDFNNDGKDDLAVGVLAESVGIITGAGAVNILYGSSSGLQASSPDDQIWHQDTSSVKDVAEDFDLFGYSLTTGDFNNDGKDDLAVGVPFEDIGSITDAGIINVLYGSSSGLQASSPDDQIWHQDSPNVDGVAEDTDFFGWSLATGDFNNDGKDDLAVGVPFEDIGSPTIFEAGIVQVLYGSSSGLQASSPADQTWSQDTSSVKDVAETNDSFGWSLAAGDFNNDGKDDLAVGVPFESVGSVLDAGAVNILYGSSSGLQASSPDDQIWHQDSPNVDGVAESGDQLGYRL
ncbi:FG-GAP repeat protein [Candidatus Nitrosocaldus islandicus]|uniref:FG-GAP repeat protein n=1 Tax=Candidatus Nitrosocaldus islandicus TaxID=2045011 RepID=UPI000CD2C954|nr:FG-GAP repeat protein [Candidatus Nitrosocaldus islandicus]